ncbi:hypothetical protein Tco_1205495 [Tanacetum coccineum]
MPNRRKRECDIRLILAPKLAKAFFTTKGSIKNGSVKLPGSPSFWGKLLWITAEHSSLSFITSEIKEMFMDGDGSSHKSSWYWTYSSIRFQPSSSVSELKRNGEDDRVLESGKVGKRDGLAGQRWIEGKIDLSSSGTGP